MANKSKKHIKHEIYAGYVKRLVRLRPRIEKVDERVEDFKAVKFIPERIFPEQEEDFIKYCKDKFLNEIGHKLFEEGYVRFSIVESYLGEKKLIMRFRAAKFREDQLKSLEMIESGKFERIEFDKTGKVINAKKLDNNELE